MAYARFVSSRGRYRPPRTGECVQDLEPRTSGLETQIFQWLSFVLGGGQQDVQFPADKRMRVDMVFDLTADVRLAIEYDGAYWHAGREEADWRKSQRLVDSGFVTDVLRIRERPLDALDPLGLSVDAKPTAPQVAQLVLLHLMHERHSMRMGRLDEIHYFLRIPSAKLPAASIHCPRCFVAARQLEIVGPGPVAPRRRRRWLGV